VNLTEDINTLPLHLKGKWRKQYYLNKYSTFEELKNDIDEYIHFYNTEKLQKRLNGLSPLEYRVKAA